MQGRTQPDVRRSAVRDLPAPPCFAVAVGKCACVPTAGRSQGCPLMRTSLHTSGHTHTHTHMPVMCLFSEADFRQASSHVCLLSHGRPSIRPPTHVCPFAHFRPHTRACMYFFLHGRPPTRLTAL